MNSENMRERKGKEKKKCHHQQIIELQVTCAALDERLSCDASNATMDVDVLPLEEAIYATRAL